MLMATVADAAAETPSNSAKYENCGRKPKMKRLILTAGMSACLATAAHSQSVTNGSFETGPISAADFVTLTAVDNSILGWTVDSGSIDYINGYWPAEDGAHSID